MMRLANKIFGITFGMVCLSLMACQPAHEGGNYVYTESSGNIDPGNGAPGGNGEIVALEKTRTATIARGHRYLDSLSSCFGLNNPSETTRTTWNENQGSLSENGTANSITSPMLTAMTKISAEVCNDMINLERGLASDQRRIFVDINLSLIHI